jgi:hypothetical protein
MTRHFFSFEDAAWILVLTDRSWLTVCFRVTVSRSTAAEIVTSHHPRETTTNGGASHIYLLTSFEKLDSDLCTRLILVGYL